MSESNKTSSKIVPAKKVVLIMPTSIKSSSNIDYVTEKKQETGKIVAIGKGEMPVKMKVGDMVAFRRYGEDKLLVEGKEFLFVTFPDILGIIQ